MFLVMLGPDENGCALEKVWPSFLVFSCMLVEIGNNLLWLIFFLKFTSCYFAGNPTAFMNEKLVKN